MRASSFLNGAARDGSGCLARFGPPQQIGPEGGLRRYAVRLSPIILPGVATIHRLDIRTAKIPQIIKPYVGSPTDAANAVR